MTLCKHRVGLTMSNLSLPKNGEIFSALQHDDDDDF